MRLVGISQVKNECDIIEQFVRHNLGFLDALFIIDNHSVDGTREILRDLTHEGLPIVVFDDPRFTRMQSAQLTGLFRTISEHLALDFVFVLDADELLVVPSRSALEDGLMSLPAGANGLIPWTTYLYSAEPADIDPIHRMTMRRRVENPAYHKAVIAVDPQGVSHVVIEPGNHAVAHALHGELPHFVVPTVALAHFPVRSARQITAKSVCGWLAILAMDPNSETTGFGHQKRDLYHRLMRQPNLSDEELFTISLNYAQTARQNANEEEDAVHEPLPISYTLRYAQDQSPEPLVILARTMENVFRPPVQVPFADLVPRLGLTTQDFDVWGVELHHDDLFLDLPPFRYLWDRFRPRSVTEIPCGMAYGQGAYARMFEEWRATDVAEVVGAVGVDASSSSARAMRPQHDLTHDLATELDRETTYDLVICTHVVDLLDEASDTPVFETINRHAREVILFCAAEGDPSRDGLVNRKPLSYWLDQWRKHGWISDAFDTLAVRTLATFPQYQRNLVVLRRVESAFTQASAFDAADLHRITRRPHLWQTASSPHIVTYPLSALSTSR